MRASQQSTVVLAALGAFAGSACAGEERSPARVPRAEQPSTTMTTTAALVTPATPAKPAAPEPVALASAVMRIVTARCDREADCRRSTDRDACANEVGHDVVGWLAEETCPNGVDAEKLASCLSDVGAESCSAEKTAADRLGSCTSDRLCRAR